MTPTWSWRLIQSGSFRLDGGAMFGIIPKVMWAKLSPPDEQNRIVLQTNCLLLRGHGRTILVETGYGNKFDAKHRGIYGLEDRWIGSALAETGTSPEEIDTVIVTHLHFDHAGGLTCVDEPGGPARATFPRARIRVQKTEWEDALANKSTMRATYLRDHLDPIAGQVDLVDGPAEVLPGIRVFPTPGHTWGQQGVEFADDAGTLVFPGDVMPTFHHSGLPFNMGYDQLPYQNLLTKRALFDRAVMENLRIVIDHEPVNPVVRVVSEGGKYSLRAECQRAGAGAS